MLLVEVNNSTDRNAKAVPVCAALMLDLLEIYISVVVSASEGISMPTCPKRWNEKLQKAKS